ncbi:acyltransferase domain-containing protein [Streptomyces sp. NPDC048290]|uniref:acyltransferase domain-containing protein n=1 Tax=Streptomyces sp. NPDC048290 TaxID=3155811 RepID=UPI003422441E
MLPDADDLPETLLDLGVPHEDISELIARHRTLTQDAAAMRLLEEAVEEIVRGMGLVGGDQPEPGAGGGFLPRVQEAPPELGGLFAVYAFIAALPHTRAYHRSRGVPDDVSRRTLADLGRNLAVHRRRYGHTGLHAPQWVRHHFCGELYQLGRLQFERARLLDVTARALNDAGIEATPGALYLSIHIPDFSGPLSPAGCDRSLARARAFFARHYPEERYVGALCHSWLLDRQLREYLPAGSNIIRFQERFTLGPEDTEPSDVHPVQFVFGDPRLSPADLPRRTSLERAVGDHLRAGGHWYTGHGWMRW